MSRILIVEDEDHLAQGLQCDLEAEGHGVEIASDGRTAAARLEDPQGCFDLVLLDLMLPGMSGFEVARRARRGVAQPRASRTGGALGAARRVHRGD